MDKVERDNLKQLAVDTIVKFDYDDPVIPIAEALEKAIEALEATEKRPHCATCDCHFDEREPS